MEYIITNKSSLRDELRKLKTEREMYSTPYKKNYILSQLKDTVCDITRDFMYMWGTSSILVSMAYNNLEIGTTALLSLLVASGFHLMDYLATIAPTLREKKPTEEQLTQLDNSIDELGRKLVLTLNNC